MALPVCPSEWMRVRERVHTRSSRAEGNGHRSRRAPLVRIVAGVEA